MNTKRLLLETVAVAFVGRLILIAEEPPPPPTPPAPPVGIEASLEQSHDAIASVELQFQAAGEHLRSQRARANHAVQLAQAAVEHDVLVGEPPEPPDPPAAPELMTGTAVDRTVQLWDATTGSALRIGDPFLPFGGSGARTEALIVPQGEPKDGFIPEMREDLAILARILNKAAGRTDEHAEAMGIVISSLPGLRQPQAMYLGGYGAVLPLSVQFPLAPAESVEKRTSEKAANSAWEQARRELYGSRPSPDSIWVAKAGPRHEVAYDPERIARLKRELTEALKNAANLRHVQDDEQVVVAVTSAVGGGGRTEVHRVVRMESRNARPTGRATGEKPVVAEVREERQGGPETTLLLRVRKADADAYATGKLDHDAFAKRVTITTY